MPLRGLPSSGSFRTWRGPLVKRRAEGRLSLTLAPPPPVSALCLGDVHYDSYCLAPCSPPPPLPRPRRDVSRPTLHVSIHFLRDVEPRQCLTRATLRATLATLLGTRRLATLRSTPAILLATHRRCRVCLRATRRDR